MLQPKIFPRRRLWTVIGALALVLGMNFSAPGTTNASDEFTLLTTDSRVQVVPLVTLFGDELEGQSQFPGSLSTSYDGQVVVTHEGVGDDGLQFEQGSVADANVQPQNVRPALYGQTGAAPGNYGATLAIANLPVGEVTISDAGTFTVGTIESAAIDVALRDVTARLLPSELLPLDAVGFDASQVLVQILGNADLKTRIVTRANDTSDYRENLAALELLDSTSDVVTNVSGSCSALEVIFGCSSRRITVDVEARESFDELLANQSVDGRFVADSTKLTLTFPVDLTITQNVLDGVLGFELNVAGQLVGILEIPTLGDFDRNGTVNALDYALWRTSFGSTTSLAADGNDDGVVDAADYVVWRNNLPVGAMASATLIPEPASDVLLLFGALIILGTRRICELRWGSHDVRFDEFELS